jgi:FtsZ-binding cell division protein ZapB
MKKGAKMNTEQIIKATKVLEGAKVMVENRDFNEFQDAIITAINALALIKELQAQIENLKKENKYLRESLADERKHKEDMKGK